MWAHAGLLLARQEVHRVVPPPLAQDRNEHHGFSSKPRSAYSPADPANLSNMPTSWPMLKDGQAAVKLIHSTQNQPKSSGNEHC
jgi:hypothetical protein